MSTLICANANDKFTEIPLGMITADEVQMAGMGNVSDLENISSYLHIRQSYWTMSPTFYNEYSNGSNVFLVYKYGYLWYAGGGVKDTTIGVRPVINLKADTLFENGGSGTSTNPYVVSGT